MNCAELWIPSTTMKPESKQNTSSKNLRKLMALLKDFSSFPTLQIAIKEERAISRSRRLFC